jgi:hypothetical protein
MVSGIFLIAIPISIKDAHCKKAFNLLYLELTVSESLSFFS